MNKQSTTSQADRQIKFRAWVHDTMYEDVFFTKVNNRLYDLYQIINGVLSHVCLCDKDTLHLMQFTGLFDKNGKEIYEADIVKTATDKAMVVGWSNRFASFVIRREGWAFQHWFGEACEASDCEIIGNLHANSNLLQG